MRRRFTAVAVCCFVAALVASGVNSAAKPGGQSLGQWMAQYWDWALGGGGAQQVKNVVFLPLPDGQPSETDPTILVGETDVRLRPGQKFALPLFVFIGERYAEPNIPDDDPGILPPEVFSGARVRLTLDGEPLIDSAVDDLSHYYFDAEYFDEPIVYEEPVEYAPDVHAVASLWVQGLGFLHNPLPKGEHTLRLQVYSDVARFGFDNTWNITVGK